MAQGAIAHSSAQAAVAITGIAGPGGGSPSKPVGTVCFGFALPGHISSATCYFSGDRNAVRQASVLHALQGLVARL